MPQSVKELLRVATLQRHHEDGFVSDVEIIDDEERWIVCVHYNDRAEGPKTRYLTSQRIPGPKRFATLSTAWKVLNELGIFNAALRKATPSEVKKLRDRFL